MRVFNAANPAKPGIQAAQGPALKHKSVLNTPNFDTVNFGKKSLCIPYTIAGIVGLITGLALARYTEPPAEFKKAKAQMLEDCSRLEKNVDPMVRVCKTLSTENRMGCYNRLSESMINTCLSSIQVAATESIKFR